MKSSNFDNVLSAQRIQEKALQKAIDTLNQQGVTDPALLTFESLQEQLDAIDSYRSRLGTLVANYMKADHRPLEINTVKPTRQWGSSYYDD